MNRRTGLLAAAIFLATSVPAVAQWLKYPTRGIPRLPDGKPNLSAPAPKMPDGKPDLSGLWSGSGAIDSDLRPEDVQPWAQAATRRSAEDLDIDSTDTRCLPPGPRISLSQGFSKIVQVPGLIVILSEAANLYRQVFLDGRELPKDPNPAWQGYSVGRWDGDTLVVETVGFNDKTSVDPEFHPHTEALRVTERYRRSDFGHIELQMIIDDPKAFTRPWTMKTELRFRPDTELLEDVCNENEKDRQHLVITERDKKEFHLDSTVLAKYAGTYEEPRAGAEPSILTVMLAGDHLVIETPRGKASLFALSETVFNMRGNIIEFVKDDHGAVSHLIARFVDSERKFVRKSGLPSAPPR